MGLGLARRGGGQRACEREHLVFRREAASTALLVRVRVQVRVRARGRARLSPHLHLTLNASTALLLLRSHLVELRDRDAVD